MKHTINATGLFLLMSLSTVAGPLDSAKKDSTVASKTGTAKTVSVLPASDDHNNSSTTAFEFSAEENKAILPQPKQVQEADAQMNIQYLSCDFRYVPKSNVNQTDALTDLQVQAGFTGTSMGKVAVEAVRKADSMINVTYKQAVSLENVDLQFENLSKMLIESDKAINAHFKKVCGMEVATSN
jgi:hypothetical protein